MIPATVDRTLISSSTSPTHAFGISTKDQAHILSILRDRLYTDKILAVLREYSSNAWDAHIEAGIPDKPIEVDLPTYLNPLLIIRDWGMGLSEDDVFQVYTQYGASTKRDSNSTVGALGIGAKSAFAYSDSFTITSFHGSKKRIYQASLDPSNVGVVQLMHEEDTTETGVEIRVPSDPKDIDRFQDTASTLFRFFRPLPNINIPLPSVAVRWYKSGFLMEQAPVKKPTWEYSPHKAPIQWTALMGCVPYRVDLSKIADLLRAKDVYDFVSSVSGGLVFPIGDVQVSANREELEYTDETLQAISDTVLKLAAEITEGAEVELKGIPEGWLRRLKAIDIRHTYGIPLSRANKHLLDSPVRLYRQLDIEAQIQQRSFDAEEDEEQNTALDTVMSDVPQTFHLRKVVDQHTRRSSRKKYTYEIGTTISVSQTSYIVVHDTEHPAGWYAHPVGVLFAVPKEKHTADEVMDELKARLTALDLEGLPLKKTSDLDYDEPERKLSDNNPKHARRYFVYDASSSHYGRGKSHQWTDAERKPEEGDLYVLLDRFEPHDNIGDIQREFRRLKSLFPEFVEPPIHGIRCGDKWLSDTKALRYGSWVAAELNRLLDKNPHVLDVLQDYVEEVQLRQQNIRTKELAKLLPLAKKHLVDSRHQLLRLLNRLAEIYRGALGYDADYDWLLGRHPHEPKILEAFKRLYERYPLLDKHLSDIARLDEAGQTAWFDYIKALDHYRKEDE